MPRWLYALTMADHGNVATSVSEPEEHPGQSPLSILDVLKAPTRTELTRKRKIDCNPQPKGKRRARGEGSSEPKTKSPPEGKPIPRPVFGSDSLTGKGGSSLSAFSQNLLGERQHSSLQDYIEASSMLQYNKH